MKKAELLIFMLLFFAFSRGDEADSLLWKKGGQGTSSFSQTAVSNWSGEEKMLFL
ncbi:MAG: hypothetical protein U5N56_12040 [Candidatus Marinimicrobia bacterium]|nr:hypothetical protein [Candidatus Neomarinimicrobiota bacterium]